MQELTKRSVSGCASGCTQYFRRGSHQFENRDARSGEEDTRSLGVYCILHEKINEKEKDNIKEKRICETNKSNTIVKIRLFLDQ